MTDAEIIGLLKMDIGEMFASPARTIFLEHIIKAAKSRIETEGITLSASDACDGDYSVEDAELIRSYAAFMVRQRDSSGAMPDSLRWALNNRLFSQKMK